MSSTEKGNGCKVRLGLLPTRTDLLGGGGLAPLPPHVRRSEGPASREGLLYSRGLGGSLGLGVGGSQSNGLDFHRLRYPAFLCSHAGVLIAAHFLARAEPSPHYSATLCSDPTTCTLDAEEREARAGTAQPGILPQSPLYQGHSSASGAPHTPAGDWVPWVE